MSIVESLLEVRLRADEDFLKIKETLTRIGVASKKENKLFQSCHILHKKGKYYIVHFKEMSMLPMITCLKQTRNIVEKLPFL